jgi:uncharacterized membrane protein YdbT with pleckstrin-like domain
MKEFTASMLSEGNKIFPVKIIISDRNIVIKTPSIFSSKERVIPFNRISSVSTVSPIIGFSSIVLETNGESSASIHGFYKNEVLEMKELILNKI